MDRRLRRALPVVLIVLIGSIAAACGEPAPRGEGAADPTRGESLFAAHCAVCHGPLGDGTDQGPPLVHVVYEPGHHGDEAFQIAVSRGVAPHHWNFGPMEPIEGLDRQDVADITAYVRELQREAGIID